jgi:hypothetical protein
LDQILGFEGTDATEQKEQIRALLKKDVLKGPPDAGEAYRANTPPKRRGMFNPPTEKDEDLVNSRLTLLVDLLDLAIDEAHSAKIGQAHLRHLVARQQATIFEKSPENTDLANTLYQLTATHARTSSTAMQMVGLTTLGHDGRLPLLSEPISWKQSWICFQTSKRKPFFPKAWKSSKL